MTEIKIDLEARIGTVLGQAKEYILDVISGEKKHIGHIGIGKGTPTPTNLGNEIGRRSILETVKETNRRTYRAFFEASYPSVDVSISEIGIFGDSTGELGSGLCVAASTVSPAVLKRVGIDSLWIEYRLYYT